MSSSVRGRTGPRFSAPAALNLAQRPALMLLVYGVCMVLVGVTASGQAGVISSSYQQSVLESVVADDAALVRAVVNSAVLLSDLPPDGPTAVRRSDLDRVLGALVQRAGILRAELRGADQALIASSDTPGSNTTARPASGLETALGGRPSAVMVTAAQAALSGKDMPAGTPLIREDLPLVAGDGGVRAVMTVWRNGLPMMDRIDALRRDVVILTLTAALVLAVILSFVFRTAQVRINRQTLALVEATRRDPTTDLLNHGAIVEALARALFVVPHEAAPVAIALIDIDNFRLVNDTLGHEAGDEVLAKVAACVVDAAPSGASIGRYGPDEILVFALCGTDVLQRCLADVRAALGEVALQRGGSDPVPITISAGLAEAPGDAQGVTELLAAAAQTLAAAKASGGDAVLTTSGEVGAAESRVFDVFQGLVIAIDNKDRYTKRHSEDVARYSLFIAELLDLDAETRRAVRLAGLLHDVGKIGIPDRVLRKPGRLTDTEYEIVKQHVALGDMIVRDLPDIDVVRAGIRHHHERWDGGGYLHGLAGNEIPLIARILSVSDAFSAMTTTRPYRKSMTVREAMVRLLDAAGTQLDEAIATTFVVGLERHPAAPLPGAPAAGLWTPRPVEEAAA